MSKIHLHIEELSLPGYTPAERRAFVAALERELAGRCVTGSLHDSHSANHKTLCANTADLSPESVARSAVTSFDLGPNQGGGRP
ncbi:MAG: hypothetical protein H6R14_1437 [Proteobacteria bacterium]|nr:hypothetical protein [Pseudomonadota bacterium]